MNRIRTGLPTRLAARVALVGLAALIAGVLSGCSAGQISQTAVQEPAVNGNRATINNVALRDIRIQATQTSDFIRARPNGRAGAGRRKPVAGCRRPTGRRQQRHRRGDA